MNQESHYKTTDLSLAAYLSLKFPIIELDKSNPKKAMFYFESSPALEKRVEFFWKGMARVEPKKYSSQVRNLKTQLYEERDAC